MEKMRPLMPVVIITGHPDEFQHASQHGVDALMQKPLNLPLLLRTVEHLIAEPESERLARLTSRSFKTQFLLPDDSPSEDEVNAHLAWRDWGIND